MLNLTKIYDHSVWISDDRISAEISARCGGIEQIDFHGAQPVSRNAKLLQHTDGVLKFTLIFGETEIPLEPDRLSLFPAGASAAISAESLKIRLEIVVCQNAFQARCRVTARKNFTKPLQFQVQWNPASQTTEVHGQRSWQLTEDFAYHSLRLKATDRIILKEWLRRPGDYQGDFLIPEGWRRIIFKNQKISGAGRLSDLHPAYLDSMLKLYDADTWIRLGNPDFIFAKPADGWYNFTSAAIQPKGKSWHSPVFSITFGTEPNFVSHPKPKFPTQKQRYRKLAQSVPKLKLPGFPAIERFFEQTPQIVASAQVQDFGMTRACPGTYYWIWAWDNMVTGLAQAHWRDLAHLRKMVDFIRRHRDVEGAIPARWSRQLEPMDSRGIGGMDFLFSELVLTLFNETQDKMVLRANYPALHQAFSFLKEKTGASGFFPTIGMYPDLPQKMGRTEKFYVAIDSGAWYSFCRNFEKIAALLGDTMAAETAAAFAQKIHKNFLSTFWDAKEGFLCDGFNPATGEQLPTYPIFSLLFLESAFGYSLLENKIPAAADFIQQNLLGENGLSMTPAWDRNHTSEPAMSGWYPHWDYVALKVLARSGNQEAISFWLSRVEACLETLGYCPEFVATNVPPAERFTRHGAAWNVNCAAGWYNALLHAVAGLDFDLGGITCRAGEKGVVEKLAFRGGLWSVKTIGSGQFISSLQVDGNEIYGTWKIPAKFYTAASHALEIRLQEQPPNAPGLTELWGAAVNHVEISAAATRFEIQGVGLTDLCFCAARRPELVLDKKSVAFEWDETGKTGTCQLELSGIHELILRKG